MTVHKRSWSSFPLSSRRNAITYTCLIRTTITAFDVRTTATSQTILTTIPPLPISVLPTSFTISYTYPVSSRSLKHERRSGGSADARGQGVGLGHVISQFQTSRQVGGHPSARLALAPTLCAMYAWTSCVSYIMRCLDPFRIDMSLEELQKRGGRRIRRRRQAEFV